MDAGMKVCGQEGVKRRGMGRVGWARLGQVVGLCGMAGFDWGVSGGLGDGDKGASQNIKSF